MRLSEAATSVVGSPSEINTCHSTCLLNQQELDSLSERIRQQFPSYTQHPNKNTPLTPHSPQNSHSADTLPPLFPLSPNQPHLECGLPILPTSPRNVYSPDVSFSIPHFKDMTATINAAQDEEELASINLFLNSANNRPVIYLSPVEYLTLNNNLHSMATSFAKHTLPGPFHELIPSDKASLDALEALARSFQALNSLEWTPEQMAELNTASIALQEDLRRKLNTPNHAQGFFDTLLSSTILDDATTKISSTIRDAGRDTATAVSDSIKEMQERLLSFFQETKLFTHTSIENFLLFATPIATMFYCHFDSVVVALQVSQLLLTFKTHIQCAVSLLNAAIINFFKEFVLLINQALAPFTPKVKDAACSAPPAPNVPSPSTTSSPLPNIHCQIDPPKFDSQAMLQHLTNALSLAFTGVAATAVISRDEKAKSLCDLARVATSMSSLYKVITELAEWSIKKVYEFLGFNADDMKITAMIPEFTTFANEVVELDNAENRVLMTSDSETCMRIQRCYIRAIELSSSIYKPNMPQHVTNRFTMLYNIIKNLYTKMLDCAPHFKDARPEPACIMLAGPSNIGKSTITKEILSILRTNFHPDIDAKEFAYYHNSGCAFYDGYVKQKALVKDDMFQTIDTAGCPNTDYIDTIRLINTAPALLPMAVAEMKKDAWMCSEYVLGSTNVQVINPSSINSAEAVTRRLHLWVEPELHCDTPHKLATDKFWGNYKQYHAHDDHSMACYTFKLKYKGATTYTAAPATSVLTNQKLHPKLQFPLIAWTFEDIVLKLFETKLLHVKTFNNPTFNNSDNKLFASVSNMNYEEMSAFNKKRQLDMANMKKIIEKESLSDSEDDEQEKLEEEEENVAQMESQQDAPRFGKNHGKNVRHRHNKQKRKQQEKEEPLKVVHRSGDFTIPTKWIQESNNVFLFNKEFFFGFEPKDVHYFIDQFPELFSDEFLQSTRKLNNTDMITYLKTINHSVFSRNFWAHLWSVNDDIKHSDFFPEIFYDMVSCLQVNTHHYSRLQEKPKEKEVYIKVTSSIPLEREKIELSSEAQEALTQKLRRFAFFDEDMPEDFNHAQMEAPKEKQKVEEDIYDNEFDTLDEDNATKPVNLEKVWDSIKTMSQLHDYYFPKPFPEDDSIIEVNDLSDRYYYNQTMRFMSQEPSYTCLAFRKDGKLQRNHKITKLHEVLLKNKDFVIEARAFIVRVVFNEPTLDNVNGTIMCPRSLYTGLTNFFDNISFGIMEKPRISIPVQTQSLATRFISSLASYASVVLEKMKSHWFFVPASLVIAGLAAYKLFRFVFPQKEKEEETTNNSEAGFDVYDTVLKKTIRMPLEQARDHLRYGAHRWQKANIKSKRIKTNAPENNFAEAARDASADQVCSSINNNLFKLEFFNTSQRIGTIHILFITGTSAIAPRHLLPVLEKSETLTLRHPSLENRTYKRSQITIINDLSIKADVFMLQFPATMGQRKKILQQFIVKEDLALDLSNTARLLSIDTTAPKITSWYTRELVAVYDVQPMRYRDLNNEIITSPSTFTYHQSTTPGMCGSPLIILNSSLQRKVAGFHIAGNDEGTRGFATPITQEDIIKLLDNPAADPRAQIGIEDLENVTPINGFEEYVIPGAQNIDVVGLVSPQDSTTTFSKSKLVRTPLYGAFGPATKEPAILNPKIVNGVWVCPLEKVLLGNTNRVPELDDELLTQITQKLTSHFMHNIRKDTVRRVLTIPEAINGIPASPFIDSLNFGTSPGYPFTLHAHSKRAFFHEPNNTPNDFLQKRIDTIIERAKRGEACLNIFTDALKDEKRTLEKVAELKTRHVAGSPLDYTITLRAWTLAFVSHVMQNRIDNCIAVGINPSSYEWTHLAEKLQSKGPDLFGGDFAQFDSTQNFQILDKIIDIINDWYNDGIENAKIRQVLWRSITNSIHIKGVYVYQLDHSLPSGNPLTAIINSFYVLISFMYCWMTLYKGTPKGNLDAFFEHVYMIVFGDDHVVNVSPDVKDKFNQQTIPALMTSMGMKYTDENKNPTPDVPTKRISEVTFLKRSFSLNLASSRYLAPLEFTVLKEMTYYIRKDVEPHSQIKNLFEFTFEQLFHHGPNAYKNWVRDVNRAVIDCELPIKLNYLSYDAQMQNYLAVNSDLTKDKTTVSEPEDIIYNAQMYSLSDGRKVTKTNITTFSDDVGIAYGTKPGHASTPSWLSAEEGDAKFLERPIKITSFLWSNANAFGSIISAIDLPDALLTNTTIKPKLENYRFLAADILVEVKFNSVSTACGTLWMFFEPFRDQIVERRFANNFGCMTGYNGLELNVGSPAAMTFLIPYISPNTYHDLKNSIVNLGTMHFAVLAPFSTILTTDTCTVDVFISFKNVKLCVHLPNTSIAAQMEATQKSEKGLISGISGPITNAAKALSGLPLIGQYFQAASWIGECVTSASTSIGLCKTPDLSASTTTNPLPGKGFTQAYGIDQGVSLSLHPANSISPSFAAFGTNIDEMSYKYIQNKYCWFGQFNLSRDDIAGTILTYFPISPALCAASFTPDVPVVFSTTLLSYLASMHQVWRGGITIRFSFAKTNYQNTRIAISVFPGFNASEIVAGLNFDAVNKVIVDLNETSVAEVTIPFQSTTPWLVSTLFNESNYALANYSNCLGMLVVSVETPLYVQANSPTSIVCNMWIKGAEDTQFAIPDFSNYYPFAQPVAPESIPPKNIKQSKPYAHASSNLSHRAPSSSASSLPKRVHNHAQVGDENEAPPGSNHMEQVNPTPGIETSTGVVEAHLQPSIFCIGEKCDNLRVLCKRTTKLTSTNLTAFTLDPSFFGIFTTATSNVCALNYISRIYRLYAGGRRYMITSYPFIAGPSNTLSLSYINGSLVFNYLDDPYLIGGASSTPSFSSFATNTYANLNPILQATVPYDRLTPCSMVSDKIYQTESFRPILLVTTSRIANVTGSSGDPQVDIYTSASDDFSFGYLVGSPAVHSA